MKFSDFMKIQDTISEQAWTDGNIFETRVSVLDIYSPYQDISLEERIIIKKKFVQPWMANIAGKSHSEVYNDAKDIAVKARPELSRILKKVATGKNPKILIDVKGHDSFVDKTFSRGKSFNLDDVLRSAILVNDEGDINATIKNIYKSTTVVEHDVKEKALGKNPEENYGYFGSHHFAIMLPDSKVVVELQLMTKRLWAFKNEAHKVYDKLRSAKSGDVPDKIRKQEMNRSRTLFSLGNTKK